MTSRSLSLRRYINSEIINGASTVDILFCYSIHCGSREVLDPAICVDNIISHVRHHAPNRTETLCPMLVFLLSPERFRTLQRTKQRFWCSNLSFCHVSNDLVIASHVHMLFFAQTSADRYRILQERDLPFRLDTLGDFFVCGYHTDIVLQYHRCNQRFKIILSAILQY